MSNKRSVSDQATASLNGLMMKNDDTEEIVSAVIYGALASKRSLFWSYKEIVNHILKLFANNQAITEGDNATSGYTQAVYMKLLHYSKDQSDNAIRAGNVYNEFVLKDVFCKIIIY